MNEYMNMSLMAVMVSVDDIKTVAVKYKNCIYMKVGVAKRFYSEIWTHDLSVGQRMPTTRQ